MNILWLHTRHGLNNFEQIAIVGVLITAFISLHRVAGLSNSFDGVDELLDSC